MTFPRSRRAIPRGRSVFLALGGVSFLACMWLSAPLFPAPARQTRASRGGKSAELAPFLGTWKARYGGKVFAILVLKEDRGALAGTLNNFDLAVDKNGNLTDGTHADSGNSPLFNVRLDAGALYFIAVQKDAYHPSTSWKLVPRNAREAELTPLLDNDPETPATASVRPIRMRRELSRR